MIIFKQFLTFNSIIKTNNIVHRCLAITKKPKFPPLNESDLVENFIKGSGPGGQNVNKSNNCCQLKHIPTGIVVAAHNSRELIENRKEARILLQQKIDLFYNKENSWLMQIEKERSLEKQEKKKRSKKNLEKKLEFKKRENLLNKDD
jgi:protein subunit release factor B